MAQGIVDVNSNPWIYTYLPPVITGLSYSGSYYTGQMEKNLIHTRRHVIGAFVTNFCPLTSSEVSSICLIHIWVHLCDDI